MFDTPSATHHSEQHSPSDDAAQGTSPQTGGRGSGQTAAEDATNEDDDEEDSSGKPHHDFNWGLEIAPPSGYGKGKGKRPAIRIEPAGDDDEDDETGTHEAEHNISNLLGSRLLDGKKKRTLSEVSNTSLLFGEEGTFPRPKIARKLSHSDGTGLLAYTPTNDERANGFENAIESSDIEDAKVADEEHGAEEFDEDYSGINYISDDDEDMEKIEKMEETFIIHDEIQNASSLFSTDFDPRRLSLDSYTSAGLFEHPSGGWGWDYPTLPMDAGFGQFFEPDAVPTSPEPTAQRKFSESSAKRVRFDDQVHASDSGSSSGSELDSTIFPDLFLPQDSIPPSLFQLMEAETDQSEVDDFPSSGTEHSFWDVGQEDARNMPGLRDLDESSEAGSSGYESTI